MLLNQDIRGVGVYRTLTLPVVTMTVAVGMVWKMVVQRRFWADQPCLETVSIEGLVGCDPSWSRSIAVVAIWIGHNMVILSGLQSIPSTYYEAAEIDGANAFIVSFPHPAIVDSNDFLLGRNWFNWGSSGFRLIFMMIGQKVQ